MERTETLMETDRYPANRRSHWQLSWLIPVLILLACVLLPTAAAMPTPERQSSTVVESHAPGPIASISIWVLEKQRQLHRQLTEALHAVDDSQYLTASGWLILVSFLYGIFHAAGPGHGKAVISAYLLTHRENLRRGILLSVSASMLQGVTAIVLVLGFLGILGWLARETMAQVRVLEMASFFLVGLLGVWLMLRGLRGILAYFIRPKPQLQTEGSAARFKPLPQTTSANGILSPGRQPAYLARATPAAAVCGCGHNHFAPPTASGAWWPTVFAVGIRPCAGAVLVLSVAFMLGIWPIGVLAVLAMSTGTAITVATLSIIAVSARDLARSMVATSSAPIWTLAGPVIACLGGLVILWLGATLFLGAMAVTPTRHPLGL
jgi:nickel/cobalt exporter